MDNRIKHVLAPTDLSDGGVTALRYARFFADRTRAGLTVLYSDPLVYPADVVGGPAAAYIGPNAEQLEALRGEIGAYAAPWLGATAHEIRACIGPPVQSIVRAAEDLATDLIVMGTHALRGWRRAILGSVTEGVLHVSRWPVVTVSSLHRMPVMHGEIAITRIVCPVNFSDVARESLAYASELAELFSAELVVVHVVEPGERNDSGADEERVRAWMAPEMRGICTFRELVLRGGAAERVLDCVDDIGADLLVIGAQHKLFRDATVIGTTTERLVRFAQCPVLTVTAAVGGRRRKTVQAELVHA